MVSVIQTFNGEDRRVVGRARTGSGVVRLLHSVEGAGSGWSVKVRGTIEDFAVVAAYRIYGSKDYCFDYKYRGQDRRAMCEVI